MLLLFIVSNKNLILREEPRQVLRIVKGQEALGQETYKAIKHSKLPSESKEKEIRSLCHCQGYLSELRQEYSSLISDRSPESHEV
jgi:hypothetical protein